MLNIKPLNFEEINNAIKQVLLKGDPASILRIDNTAGYVIECLLRNEFPDINFFNEASLIQGGVFPHDLNFAYDKLFPQIIQLMKKADILGFVDVAQSLDNMPEFLQHFSGRPIFNGHRMLVMDPGALLGKSMLGECVDPWTKYLEGKRVLAISTHARSIKYQWKNIDKIWGHNKKIIAPFELVDVIRSPYHPIMDSRQYFGCNSWEDSVNYIKKLMEEYDFDVLLSGSTTSSPFYVEHAKKLGKIGIQTGGTIQLFFGVLGYRWTKVEGYKRWHEIFNEHWIYPLEVDEPENRKKYLGLETNFAYW